MIPASTFCAPPPLALYVHIPWCERKCPYCDFNSHESGDAVPEDRYVDALLADLEQSLPLVWGRTVQCAFIGGGTPSLFSPRAIDRLLAGVRARVMLAPGAEITLEANPGTIDRGTLPELRSAGVTRISLGVQSLDDDLLARIGRIHDAAQARAAAEWTAAAGFASWNIDLMYGLPGQTTAGAISDVRAALALQPPHVSHYQLTIEPGTAFFLRPPPRPPDDTLWEMQVACQEEFAVAGRMQYEVSAWAVPGAECRHNLNYWRFGDYLGIGAGAHAKITLPAEQAVERQARARSPQGYMTRAARPDCIVERRRPAGAELAFEFMMNALRLVEGFESPLFVERTGLPLATVDAPLRRAEQLGLIECTPARVVPTARGRRYLDDLVALFLPD